MLQFPVLETLASSYLWQNSNISLENVRKIIWRHEKSPKIERPNEISPTVNVLIILGLN